MKLTKKIKALSAKEKLEANEHKQRLIMYAGNRCTECYDYFPSFQLQLAHVISKADRNIKKYGYEVIFHDLNMKVTCSKCNSGVMINTSKTELVKEHLKPIHEDLRSKGYEIEEDI